MTAGLVTGIALNGLVDAAATALKLTPAELSAKLRSGDSLKEVATAKGVDYAGASAAATGALDKALAAAVTAGDLTQSRADELRTHIVGEIADGTWPDHLGGRGPWGTARAADPRTPGVHPLRRPPLHGGGLRRRARMTKVPAGFRRIARKTP